VVKVGGNVPELISWSSQNHFAFLDPIFSKFLLDLWSLAARTLFQGLES